ncbi:MAG: hypothetical protein ABI876_16770, partial [Bacteroidota bacterium]
NSAIEQEHQRNTGTVARPVSQPVVTPTSPAIAITGGEESESEMPAPPMAPAEHQMEPTAPRETELPAHRQTMEMPAHQHESPVPGPQADEHATPI